MLAHTSEADIVSGDRPGAAGRPEADGAAAHLPVPGGDLPSIGRSAEPCPIDEKRRRGRHGRAAAACCTSPGDSPGHLAFSWPERGLLLLRGRDHDLAALRGRLARLPPQPRAARRTRSGGFAALDAAIVGVGHGDPITDGCRRAGAQPGRLARARSRTRSGSRTGRGRRIVPGRRRGVPFRSRDSLSASRPRDSREVVHLEREVVLRACVSRRTGDHVQLETALAAEAVDERSLARVQLRQRERAAVEAAGELDRPRARP